MLALSSQISVAMVTRNRPDSLERSLRSLRAQSAQPLELVVSDDSDDTWAGQTHRVVEKYGGSYVRGPRLGLYANRNNIIQYCKGTHIRTMDDDHEFPEGHWARCEEAVRSDPVSVWIIGEFQPNEPKLDTPECPGQLNPRGYSSQPPDPQHCWAISDGASIYPRELFTQGVRYLDDFKFGASYLELGSLLHWLKIRIRFLNRTYVIHHYDPNARSFMDLQIDLGSRFAAMCCHSWLYQPGLVNRAMSLAETLKLMLLHRSVAIRAWRAGRKSYRSRRQAVLQMARTFHPPSMSR